MTQELIIRILVAALLGGIIGLEREYRAKEAGFRTHFLVALGSALFMVLSQYGFGEALEWHSNNPNVRVDLSRIAAQVVSGIGFIGAGTIIFQKHVVHGLTTAAGVWVAAAIGMACGAGMYIIAASATVLVLLGLEAMNYVLSRIGSRNVTIRFTAPSEQAVREVLARITRLGMKIDSYSMERKHTESECTYEAAVDMRVRRRRYEERVVGLLDDFSGVTVDVIE